MLTNQINKLNDFQFKDELLNSFKLHDKIDNNYKKKVKKEKNKNNPLRNDIYIANETDKLFWYFFILKYGFFEYELVANKTFIREKEEKIKLIEQIRENKREIKNIKCKINFLEGELLDNDNISVQTFLCCCFIK